MKPSAVTFTSHNRMLDGQILTITVGDRVKFHPVGRSSTYLARVVAIGQDRVHVVVERAFSGGDTAMHRWRRGHRVAAPLDEIHELVSRETRLKP